MEIKFLTTLLFLILYFLRTKVVGLFLKHFGMQFVHHLSILNNSERKLVYSGENRVIHISDKRNQILWDNWTTRVVGRYLSAIYFFESPAESAWDSNTGPARLAFVEWRSPAGQKLTLNANRRLDFSGAVSKFHFRSAKLPTRRLHSPFVQLSN